MNSKGVSRYSTNIMDYINATFNHDPTPPYRFCLTTEKTIPYTCQIILFVLSVYILVHIVDDLVKSDRQHNLKIVTWNFCTWNTSTRSHFGATDEYSPNLVNLVWLRSWTCQNKIYISMSSMGRCITSGC